jgi:hypothetical protein
MRSLIAACCLALACTAFSTVSFADPKCPPFSCTSTQGGSDNTCHNNSGCTTTKQNPAGNNQTCTGPGGQCQ